jgi:hypothetical protein
VRDSIADCVEVSYKTMQNGYGGEYDEIWLIRWRNWGIILRRVEMTRLSIQMEIEVEEGRTYAFSLQMPVPRLQILRARNWLRRLWVMPLNLNELYNILKSYDTMIIIDRRCVLSVIFITVDIVPLVKWVNRHWSSKFRIVTFVSLFVPTINSNWSDKIVLREGVSVFVWYTGINVWTTDHDQIRMYLSQY